MKHLLILLIAMAPHFCGAAAYIKFDGVDGESKAIQEASRGYDQLATSRAKVQAADGQEGRLSDGYYLREDGRLLEVKQGRTRWISQPRDAASGLATGKRQHKPVTVTKPVDKATPLLIDKSSCVNGKVSKGEHKGKACEHRGHVTVLK